MRAASWVFWMGWVILLSTAVRAEEPKEAKPKVGPGDVAPDFCLRDREGNLVRLSDFTYSGQENARKKKKQVMLDFFATDCKACIAELPQVKAFYEKNKAEIQLLMIAVPEREDGNAKLDKFLTDNAIPFPVLVDGYETVSKKYIANGNTLTLPSIFVIDKNAKVRALFVGLEKDLETSVKNALANTAPFK
jgi:peroxiredoxin